MIEGFRDKPADRKLKKEILSTLLALSVPTVLEEILSTLLQYVDTAMVGRLGEQATAAVSVTTTISWLVHGLPSAIGVAVLAMISRAVGSRDEKMVRRISGQILILVVGCGAITGGISLILSPYIPKWMGAEQAIWKQASTYFSIISLPMIFRVAGMVFGAAIRGTKDTRTPMLINMGANILNVLLNYLLIYTAGWGVTGAAAASAISYTLTGILMFAAFRRNRLLGGSGYSLQPDREIMKECAGIGLPVLGTNVVSCLGYVVFAGLVAGMGTTVFAAHSIAVTAETIFYIPGYGLRTATSAMVGISLGEGERKKFEITKNLSVAITVIMMCLTGLVLYLVSYPLMCLFTNSERVAVLGSGMLRLVAFSEPFFGLMIVMEGIFYGLGKTRYAFWVETLSMWGIRIFFTFLCVRIWSLPLRAVWYCMIADNVVKAVLLTLPMLNKKKIEGWIP